MGAPPVAPASRGPTRPEHRAPAKEGAARRQPHQRDRCLRGQEAVALAAGCARIRPMLPQLHRAPTDPVPYSWRRRPPAETTHLAATIEKWTGPRSRRTYALGSQRLRRRPQPAHQTDQARRLRPAEPNELGTAHHDAQRDAPVRMNHERSKSAPVKCDEPAHQGHSEMPQVTCSRFPSWQGRGPVVLARQPTGERSGVRHTRPASRCKNFSG